MVAVQRSGMRGSHEGYVEASRALQHLPDIRMYWDIGHDVVIGTAKGWLTVEPNAVILFMIWCTQEKKAGATKKGERAHPNTIHV